MRGYPGTAQCGKNSGYSRHRRLGEPVCPACRKARTAYNKRLRYRIHVTGERVKVDATGTRRRVQALARIGHRFEDIGALIGVRHCVVSMYAKASYVQAETAEKVRQVYERLSGTPGASDITRRRAIAKGWVAPLDWEGRNIDDPRALSHSQFSALVRAGQARKKAAA